MSVYFLHWHEGEARSWASELAKSGTDVQLYWNADDIRFDAGDLPEAVVISLERLPSHGRAVAAVSWESKKRRSIPIIFVGGSKEKIAQTQKSFPTASYCSITQVSAAIRSALSKPKPTVDSIPRPSTSGYSGKPLVQKLNLNFQKRAAFIHAPNELAEWLDALPDDFKPATRIVNNLEFAMVFTKSAGQLQPEFSKLAQSMAEGGVLWVSWPKKSSKVKTDITEDVVRKIGLAEGWVDVKVCAVSEVWSGLKFLRRRKPSSAKKK